jgi:hypothetical protein
MAMQYPLHALTQVISGLYPCELIFCRRAARPDHQPQLKPPPTQPGSLFYEIALVGV